MQAESLVSERPRPERKRLGQRVAASGTLDCIDLNQQVERAGIECTDMTVDLWPSLITKFQSFRIRCYVPKWKKDSPLNSDMLSCTALPLPRLINPVQTETKVKYSILLFKR
jgi:hypothetical protein